MYSFKTYFIWALGSYLFLCAGFYFFQHLFFFHPTTLAADHRFAFGNRFEEKHLASPATDIHWVRFQPADSIAKGVVLYFHGNKINIEHYAQYAAIFTTKGYEVWMIDYPGYGKSKGDMTQQNFENAALQLYQLAATKFGSQHIIIYGKSLGTGPAACLAAKRPCNRLVLETPYFSMNSMALRYISFIPISLLIKMNFQPGESCKKIIAPIVIFHGLQDEVIPFTESLQLATTLKKGDMFIAIPGGRHNDLTGKPIYKQVMDSLLTY